jgi:hypothetical protein
MQCFSLKRKPVRIEYTWGSHASFSWHIAPLERILILFTCTLFSSFFSLLKRMPCNSPTVQLAKKQGKRPANPYELFLNPYRVPKP